MSKSGRDSIEVINPAQLGRPVGPYSQAVRAGELIFCAGQLALDPADSRPMTGLSAADQTRKVLQNLSRVLEDGGSSLTRVVKTTIYLTDLNDYAAVNDVYREFFPDPPPARATVQVARLIGDLRVEIDAIGLLADAQALD